MKPEPLRGKVYLNAGDPKLDQHYEFAKKKDIQAAVEFAIKKIKERKEKLTYTEAIIIINMSFEDVMK